MRIGLLCGSLSVTSANQAALAVIAARLQKNSEVTTEEIVGLPDIPAFDPAAVAAAPDVVLRFQTQISQLDGVVLAAPEYAAGLAGSTKNALDWLVGSSSLYRTPVVALSAGTTGGQRAIEQLVHTLSWQGAWTVATLGIEVPRTKMTDGDFSDNETIIAIEQLADSLIAVVRGSGQDRRSALEAVVTRFGIDVERFGEVN